jgi:hypothetical protein
MYANTRVAAAVIVHDSPGRESSPHHYRDARPTQMKWARNNFQDREICLDCSLLLLADAQTYLRDDSQERAVSQ